jgi:hypothetical protein
MKNKRGAALARYRTYLYRLFCLVDARKRLVMISDNIIFAEEAVEFDGIETVRT